MSAWLVRSLSKRVLAALLSLVGPAALAQEPAWTGEAGHRKP